MMEILITGGTGFIGRHLAKRLLGEGQEVTVLSRQAPERVRALCGAVTPVRHLSEVSASPQVVVNLAGEPIVGPRWSRARKGRLWESRVGLTRRLVNWLGLLSEPPELLISGSAVGYYGDRGDEELEEETPPLGESFSVRLCHAWERAAWSAEALGTRVCVLRTGPVLGRGGGLLDRMLTPFRLGLGGPLGHGDQWLAWIHLDDHLRMIRFLMDRRDLDGPFNATAPHPVTSRAFARTLGRVLRRPALLRVPQSLLKPMLGEQAEVPLGSQRVIPKRFLASGFEFRYPELEEALRQILK